MTTNAQREAQAREAQAAEEAAAGDSLPQGAKAEDARYATVDAKAYPERPYAEALTDEHRAVLKDADQLPPKD